MGSFAAEKRAYSWAQFFRLFEGPSVRAFYMAERVTYQLDKNEDLVPML